MFYDKTCCLNKNLKKKLTFYNFERLFKIINLYFIKNDIKTLKYLYT